MPTLNFNIQRQVLSNWCWAAVATSVFKYYRPRSIINQRKFVADFFDNAQCDVANPAPACNKTASLSEALHLLNIFNGRVDNYVHPDVIEDELGINRPVCCLLQHPRFEGHFVVISALFRHPDNPNQISVRVEDPFDASEQIVPYSELINGYRNSFWVKTYYTKPLPSHV